MKKRNILITGGGGFIGSHVVNHFSEKYPQDKIIIMDSQTYACDLSNIGYGCNPKRENGKNTLLLNPEFGDIRDSKSVELIFERHKITHVIHLAAESHVDNSISNPNIFVETNVNGTVNLLNACLKYWKKDNYENHRFHHVSTDEVYGSLELDSDTFTENTPYAPHSPYSASKASSDHFVRAYHDTYGLPVTISNCSNNYGPHQHTEKLIPKIISNLRDGKDIPVYGTGENIRDWLYVGDHVKAIDFILENGFAGYEK
jgi:dTDP-glucose 4,6-dehydratase